MSIATGLRPGVADSVGLPGREVVASHTTYKQTQLAVDHLSDSSFPVEHTAIVGRDLSLVERGIGPAGAVIRSATVSRQSSRSIPFLSMMVAAVVAGAQSRGSGGGIIASSA